MFKLFRPNNPSETDTPAETGRSRNLAIAGFIGGSAMVAVSVFGILSNEAKDEQDALGSVTFGEDHTYYFETEEVPFVVLGAMGSCAVILSVAAIRRKEEE